MKIIRVNIKVSDETYEKFEDKRRAKLKSKTEYVKDLIIKDVEL